MTMRCAPASTFRSASQQFTLRPGVSPRRFDSPSWVIGHVTSAASAYPGAPAAKAWAAHSAVVASLGKLNGFLRVKAVLRNDNRYQVSSSFDAQHQASILSPGMTLANWLRLKLPSLQRQVGVDIALNWVRNASRVNAVRPSCGLQPCPVAKR